MMMTTAAITPMKWADKPTHDDNPRCACCDRILKPGSKTVWVEVIDGGSSVAAPGLGVDTTDPGYMGFFEVGRKCAKTHFHGFTQ